MMQKLLRWLVSCGVVVCLFLSIAPAAIAQMPHDTHRVPMSSAEPTGSQPVPPSTRKLTPRERQAMQAYNRGLDFLAQGNERSAIRAFTQSIKLNPQDDLPYKARGDLHQKIGNYRAALEDYSAALKINPYFTDLLNNRGAMREKVGDLTGAIADYTLAIDGYPEEGIGYSRRGYVRYQLGDVKGAMEDFAAAIDINPGYAGTYANRGSVYEHLGKRQAAMKDYQKAMELFTQRGEPQKAAEMTVRLEKLTARTQSASS